jgi:hypothetical protein
MPLPRICGAFLAFDLDFLIHEGREDDEGHEDALHVTIFNLRELPDLRELRGEGFTA